MNAYVLHEIGDLRYEQADTPQIREGWALVEVMAAGICASDIPRIFELGTYQFPTIPGHEFSGIVRQVGVSEDKSLIGKRVGVYPLIPCRECDNCRMEHYELCKSYDYLGSRRDGCFAEYVAIPVWNLIELPDEVSFAEAAMLEPMAAALHALRRMPTSEIKSIVVYGADFMGLLIAQWARLYGISEVYIVGQKAEQCEIASELGFQRICCTKEKDAVEWLRSSTEGVMADAAIEAIGSSESLMKCIQSVHANGYIVSSANPCENITLDQNVYWKILRKQIKLAGAWNSRFSSSTEDDWKDSVEMLLARRIDTVSLVTHDYPFRDLADGLRIMRDDSEFYEKILLNKSSKTRMVYR